MVGFGLGGVLMGRPGRPLRRDGAGADRRGQPGPAGFACRRQNILGSRSSSCCSAFSAARPPSRRWWPTPRCGSCAARHRGGGLRQQQLPGRRAIWPPIVQHWSRVGWRGAYKHARRGQRGTCRCSRWRCGRAPAWAGGRHHAARCSAQPIRAALRLLDEPGAGAAVRGRRGLLRGDVDAAGAHRRLLHRPRLRRRARRRRCSR